MNVKENRFNFGYICFVMEIKVFSMKKNEWDICNKTVHDQYLRIRLRLFQPIRVIHSRKIVLFIFLKFFYKKMTLPVWCFHAGASVDVSSGPFITSQIQYCGWFRNRKRTWSLIRDAFLYTIYFSNVLEEAAMEYKEKRKKSGIIILRYLW